MNHFEMMFEHLDSMSASLEMMKIATDGRPVMAFNSLAAYQNMCTSILGELRKVAF